MPQRIQLRRTKGWRKPAGAVVCSRPSRWGNPWRVGTGIVEALGEMDGPGAGMYDPNDVRWYELTLREGLTAAETVRLYSEDLETNLADPDPHFDELREALAGLRGHDLGCYCALDEPCHVDVLLEIANR